jgi:hypothetical protein
MSQAKINLNFKIFTKTALIFQTLYYLYKLNTIKKLEDLQVLHGKKWINNKF